jgi:predicted hydrolase (HD superfamily)
MRYLLIAFSRKIAQKGGILKELSKEDVDEMIDEVNAEAREMQAGYLAETARAVYAVDVQSMFIYKSNLIEAYFKLSKE